MTYRTEVWAKDINLGVNGIYTEFKLARLIERAKGENVCGQGEKEQNSVALQHCEFGGEGKTSKRKARSGNQWQGKKNQESVMSSKPREKKMYLEGKML